MHSVLKQGKTESFQRNEWLHPAYRNNIIYSSGFLQKLLTVLLQNTSNQENRNRDRAINTVSTILHIRPLVLAKLTGRFNFWFMSLSSVSCITSFFIRGEDVRIIF